MNDSQQSGGGRGLVAPPPGVTAGESIPRENEAPDLDEAKIEATMGGLKTFGEPYTDFSESELRERAITLLRNRED